MNRQEFVNWFEGHMCFEKEGEYYYRCLMDYSENLYDYVYIEQDHVVYKYENLYMGGSENCANIFSFEEFIKADIDNTLKM